MNSIGGLELRSCELQDVPDPDPRMSQEDPGGLHEVPGGLDDDELELLHGVSKDSGLGGVLGELRSAFIRSRRPHDPVSATSTSRASMWQRRRLTLPVAVMASLASAVLLSTPYNGN